MIALDSDIEDIIKEVNDNCDDLVLDLLDSIIDIARQAYDLAVSSQAYKDVSGNLRSSIGYGVYFDGTEIVVDGFVPVGNGSGGASKGQAFLRSLAAKYQSGVVLILVAGEDYAVTVESRGQSVITDGALLAESLVNQLFL